jgi:hypothetical protein
MRKRKSKRTATYMFSDHQGTEPLTTRELVMLLVFTGLLAFILGLLMPS